VWGSGEVEGSVGNVELDEASIAATEKKKKS